MNYIESSVSGNSKTMLESAGTTNGREVKECADVGVMIRESTVGVTMGPPADSE